MVLLLSGPCFLAIQATVIFQEGDVMTASGSRSGESTSTIRDRAHNMAGKVVDTVQEAAGRMVGTGQDGDTTAGKPGEAQSVPIMDQAAEQVT